MLLNKGIRTFGDFKKGIVDKENPRGYKVRMTATDVNRGRVIVLPDDISFYGIEPDNLEVSKAIRMSISVPFVFKPVEIRRKTGFINRKYYIVDGGVLDNFPTWLIEQTDNTLGFRLDFKQSKKTFYGIESPLDILKGLINSVHNLGIPHKFNKLKNIAEIDTSKVSFLEFGLTDEEKKYLYEQGKHSANILLNSIFSI